MLLLQAMACLGLRSRGSFWIAAELEFGWLASVFNPLARTRRFDAVCALSDASSRLCSSVDA